MGRIVLALSAATLAASPLSTSAEVIDVRTTTGSPRIAVSDGRAVAWRNVAVRASAGALEFEIGVPTCVPISAATRLQTGERSGDCAAQGGRLDPRQSASWYAVRWGSQLPTAAGPRIEVSLRRSQWPTNGASNAAEYDADVSLTQPVGPLDLYGGGAARSARWRGSATEYAGYAGAAIAVAKSLRAELLGEVTRTASAGAFDRALTLRIVGGQPEGALLTAFLTRAQDDLRETWRAGIAVEHRF